MHLVTPAVPAPAGPGDAMDVVLDTNIWLDLLVFADPGVKPIGAALATGRLRAWIDAFAVAELTRVLGYRLGRHLLDAPARAEVVERCAGLASTFARGTTPAPPAAAPLPTCRDPHDQPFLELARDCRARWLVTKDRDLLMLARNNARLKSFAIIAPQTAVALLREGAAA